MYILAFSRCYMNVKRFSNCFSTLRCGNKCALVMKMVGQAPFINCCMLNVLSLMFFIALWAWSNSLNKRIFFNICCFISFATKRDVFQTFQYKYTNWSCCCKPLPEQHQRTIKEKCKRKKKSFIFTNSSLQIISWRGTLKKKGLPCF